MNNTEKPIIITGAGITGLTTGYRLARSGKRVIVVEKEQEVGGLARSFRYGDHRFDIGPHRFHSADSGILSFIREILGERETRISRHSGVYFYGRYYTWPLKPDALFSLPPRMTLKSAWDLLAMKTGGRHRRRDSFESYTIHNYGPTLYNAFFGNYTRKFLGMAPDETHWEWASLGMKRAVINEDVASRNLIDILKLMLRPVPPSRNDFIYARGGIGVFSERLAEGIVRAGGEVLTGERIAGLSAVAGKVDSVTFGSGRIEHPEHLVWTAPARDLCAFLDVPWKDLSYRSLIIYNVEAERTAGSGNGYQWCYYGSDDIVFSRVSTPSLFDPGMTPAGKAGLCVEVTCQEGDTLWERPETATDTVREHLKKFGLVTRAADTGNVHVERIPDAYPRYTLDFRERIDAVRQGIGERAGNITLAGRTGLFWYNNMDDSIRNGLDTARRLAPDASGTPPGGEHP